MHEEKALQIVRSILIIKYLQAFSRKNSLFIRRLLRKRVLKFDWLLEVTWLHALKISYTI